MADRNQSLVVVVKQNFWSNNVKISQKYTVHSGEIIIYKLLVAF